MCSLQQSIMSKVNKKEEEILEQKGIKVGDRVSTKFRSGAVLASVPALLNSGVVAASKDLHTQG